MVDAIAEKLNERSRSWYEMMESSSNPSEIVVYHKVKRKFLNLVDMEKEDPNFRFANLMVRILSCRLSI